VSSGDTNVVKIIESGAELRANQWVGWWVKLTCDAIWLEAEDTSSCEINIISPSSDDRVSLNSSARNSSSRQTLLKSLPSLSVGHVWGAWLLEAIVNEAILSSVL
jgi:hypothetical protein